jgi:hypothetical protein
MFPLLYSSRCFHVTFIQMTEIQFCMQIYDHHVKNVWFCEPLYMLTHSFATFNRLKNYTKRWGVVIFTFHISFFSCLHVPTRKFGVSRIRQESMYF